MRIRTLALVALSGTLAACATTSTPEPKQRAQIQIQEQVGFTISEPVSVSETVRMDYDSALFLLEQGQADEGIAMLERVVAAAPDVSGPRIDLGIATHRQGDLDAAEQHLLAALELNPDHPVVHNELGIIYRKTGRFAEARRSYEAALSIYPGYHHARRNLGVLCDLYLADLDCALESYEAYLETVPEDAQASMWIADLQNRMGRQE
jgi:Flp pilus assembly protein TadD